LELNNLKADEIIASQQKESQKILDSIQSLFGDLQKEKTAAGTTPLKGQAKIQKEKKHQYKL
jgi:hypothetical protein